MNKRVILSVVIILLVALITGCNNKENDITKNQNTVEESLNSKDNNATNNKNKNSNTISNINEKYTNTKEDDFTKNQNTVEESLNSKENNATNNKNTNSNTNSNTNEENTNTKEEDTNNKDDVNMSDVKIIINDKEYSINLEKNETVKELIKLLPLDITMRELNGNEKYIYLDNTLPSNPANPKHINRGDVMLYGNNCLVIFYKSFDTSYSYTRIGYIDNLPDLGSGDISVKIEK